MYQQVFPPDLEKPSLAIIGLVQPIGSTIPITEMQSRWVTRIVGVSGTTSAQNLPNSAVAN